MRFIIDGTVVRFSLTAIYKNLRNLQRKLDLAPGPTPIINRLGPALVQQVDVFC